MRALLTLAVLVQLAACSDPGQVGFGVALEVRFGGSVSDDALARVTRFRFHVTGDETRDDVVPLMRTTLRTERVVYRPLPSSRQLTIEVSADDASGNALFAGTTPSLALIAGATTSAIVTLETVTIPDAGSPPDLLAGDQSVPSDLGTKICAPGGPFQSCTVGGDVYFCSGFEEATGQFGFSYTCAGANFMCGPATSAAVVEHVTTPLCHGNQVFHAGTAAVSSHDAYLGQFLPPTTKTFYARLFVYKKSSSADVKFLNFLEATSTDLGAPGARSIALSWLGQNTFRLNGQDFVHAATTLDSWTCIELFVNTDSTAAGDLKLWIDEDLIGDLAGPTVDPSYYFGTFALGVWASSSAQSTDIYFDEVVLSKSRIGCK